MLFPPPTSSEVLSPSPLRIASRLANAPLTLRRAESATRGPSFAEHLSARQAVTKEPRRKSTAGSLRETVRPRSEPRIPEPAEKENQRNPLPAGSFEDMRKPASSGREEDEAASPVPTPADSTREAGPADESPTAQRTATEPATDSPGATGETEPSQDETQRSGEPPPELPGGTPGLAEAVENLRKSSGPAAVGSLLDGNSLAAMGAAEPGFSTTTALHLGGQDLPGLAVAVLPSNSAETLKPKDETPEEVVEEDLTRRGGLGQMQLADGLGFVPLPSGEKDQQPHDTLQGKDQDRQINNSKKMDYQDDARPKQEVLERVAAVVTADRETVSHPRDTTSDGRQPTTARPQTASPERSAFETEKGRPSNTSTPALHPSGARLNPAQPAYEAVTVRLRQTQDNAVESKPLDEKEARRFSTGNTQLQSGSKSHKSLAVPQSSAVQPHVTEEKHAAEAIKPAVGESLSSTTPVKKAAAVSVPAVGGLHRSSAPVARVLDDGGGDAGTPVRASRTAGSESSPLPGGVSSVQSGVSPNLITAERHPPSQAAERLQSVERLVDLATLHKRFDSHRLELLVQDELLGRISLRLTERAGLVDAMLRADSVRGRDLLVQSLPSLMDALARRGLEPSTAGNDETKSGTGGHGFEQPKDGSRQPRREQPREQPRTASVFRLEEE